MFKEYPKFMYYEVLEYGRKSRFDDPYLSTEEVLEKHARMIRDYAERHLGGEIPEENRYMEIGSGETIKARPEVQRLLKAIESPKIKAIIVVDVQRLSRGDLEDAGKLIKLLRYSETYVITPERTYDLRDEYDRDAFERELKRGSEYLEYFKKISLRGKLDSVREGNYIGSVAPFGFDRTTVQCGNKTCHTLKERKDQADIVRLVFDWYCNDDVGVTAICRRLESMNIKTKSGSDRWNPTIIWSMLENVHYIGCVRWNWRKTIKIIKDQEIKELRPKAKIKEYLVFNGKHEGIVSEELFNRAAEIRGNRHKAKSDTTLKNPFSGIMVCKRCGHKIGYNTYVNNGIEYARPKLRCNNQVHCKSGSVDFDEVMERFCDGMQDIIDDFIVRIDNDQDDSIKLHRELVKSLEKKLEDLAIKEQLQWEERQHPDPELRMPPHIFKELNAKLLREREEINEALCKAKDSAPDPVDYKELSVKFTDALKALKDPNLDASHKNRLLKDIIDKIEYDRPANVKLTKENMKEFGYDKLEKGNMYHSFPYDIFIKIK